MSATIDRSLSQRRRALLIANSTRELGKDWKAEMAARPYRQAIQEAVRVLREDPESVGALSIHAFLTSIPKIGDTKAQRMLTNRGEGWYIWPFRRVRDLTPRQRQRLSEVLAGGRHS